MGLLTFNAEVTPAFSEILGAFITVQSPMVISLAQHLRARPLSGKTGFLGPWIRWAVVRRNTFAGLSLAAKAHADPPACAAVTLSGVSSDIVAEHDTFECVQGAETGGYRGDMDICEHCSFRTL